MIHVKIIEPKILKQLFHSRGHRCWLGPLVKRLRQPCQPIPTASQNAQVLQHAETRRLLPDATQYKAETTHNTTLRLHNTTQKLHRPTQSLPWQPEAAQCSPEAAHHNPEVAADTLGADHCNPEVTQDTPRPPNTIPRPPNITPGLPNASHAAHYHLEVVQCNPRAMLSGNDQSKRCQN